jgi:hypothetical protein
LRVAKHTNARLWRKAAVHGHVRSLRQNGHANPVG